MPPGSYVFAVSWPFGGATFTADVLAGHPRHVNVAVCNIMHLRESHRSVYGVLPGAGYAVTVDYPSGSVPASVDGGAYYAAGLPPGALTVRLYLSTDTQQYCDFRVSQGSDDWADEHIRYDISASTIHSSRSCKF